MIVRQWLITLRERYGDYGHQSVIVVAPDQEQAILLQGKVVSMIQPRVYAVGLPQEIVL